MEEKGSRISDIKNFFNSNGFTAQLKLFDINHIIGNEASLQELFPFILPINSKNGLHYVVINELKNRQLKIYDPAKGSQYFLSLQEIKRKSHFNKNHWDLTDTEEKIIAICTQDLAEYHLNFHNVLIENGHTLLFNKLTYFKYLKENFGFKDSEAERNFLKDLLKNQEISAIPNNFKILEFEKGKIKNNSPLILVVKENENQKEAQESIPEENNSSLYWQLFNQLGEYKKLWYIYIFAALFSAATAQFAVFTNQIMIDNVLPTYNLNTLVLFAIGLGIYKVFDIFTTVYKNFVGIHLGNALDRYFLFSFDKKINNSSLSYIHSYKKGD